MAKIVMALIAAIFVLILSGLILPLVPGLRGGDQGLMMTLNGAGQFVSLILAIFTFLHVMRK